jgi:hypothetical protein
MLRRLLSPILLHAGPGIQSGNHISHSDLKPLRHCLSLQKLATRCSGGHRLASSALHPSPHSTASCWQPRQHTGPPVRRLCLLAGSQSGQSQALVRLQRPLCSQDSLPGAACAPCTHAAPGRRGVHTEVDSSKKLHVMARSFLIGSYIDLAKLMPRFADVVCAHGKDYIVLAFSPASFAQEQRVDNFVSEEAGTSLLDINTPCHRCSNISGLVYACFHFRQCTASAAARCSMHSHLRNIPTPKSACTAHLEFSLPCTRRFAYIHVIGIGSRLPQCSN